jgi:AcrR family transcriptional regulator
MKGTKELVLKTARKLFGKKGITNTSMDDIAGEAKIGKGTIYHYYDSKEKLFIEVAENEVEILRKILETAIDNVDGPEEKLRAYVKARFKLIAEVAKVFNMFKEEYVEYYAYIKKVQDKFVDFELGKLREFLEEGDEKGIFSVADPAFVAFALSREIHAMEYFFGVQENHDIMEKKAGIILDMILNGLKKR